MIIKISYQNAWHFFEGKNIRYYPSESDRPQPFTGEDYTLATQKFSKGNYEFCNPIKYVCFDDMNGSSKCIIFDGSGFILNDQGQTIERI